MILTKFPTQAMNDMGFSKDDQTTIWSLIAVVLHLGALQFVPAPGDHCKIANADVVNNIASLLKTDVALVQKALTFRLVAARSEVYETKLVSGVLISTAEFDVEPNCIISSSICLQAAKFNPG